MILFYLFTIIKLAQSKKHSPSLEKTRETMINIKFSLKLSNFSVQRYYFFFFFIDSINYQ